MGSSIVKVVVSFIRSTLHIGVAASLIRVGNETEAGEIIAKEMGAEVEVTIFITTQIPWESTRMSNIFNLLILSTIYVKHNHMCIKNAYYALTKNLHPLPKLTTLKIT